jgi:hypothetical protein
MSAGPVPPPTASGSSTPIAKPVFDPNVVPDFQDEQREKERLAAEKRQAEAVYRDAERRLENRERQRIAAVERERGIERATRDREDQERVLMRERLATWDDEKEMERGREFFYADRWVPL